MTDRLAELSAAGVSIWLDDISRERLVTGGLDALRRDQHVVGVTSNPTIFAKALAESDDYAEQVRDLALRGVDVEEAARMITTQDVRWACDVMRPAYDASSGVDGRVSIEVDPRLAHATDKTVAEAQGSWRGWSTGPTRTSRSRRPARASRRSRRPWPWASASTSRSSSG